MLRLFAADNAGHRGDMVGFNRVLHAEQKTKSKDGKQHGDLAPGCQR
jgi:hypothetical protein